MVPFLVEYISCSNNHMELLISTNELVTFNIVNQLGATSQFTFLLKHRIVVQGVETLGILAIFLTARVTRFS